MKGKVIIKNVMKEVCMRCSAADVERDIDTTRLVLDSSADLKHNTRCETKCPTHTGAEYINLWGTLGRYLPYLCLLTYSDVQHILCCFCFVFLRLVYPMFPVSLDLSFLIAPSMFSDVCLFGNQSIHLRTHPYGTSLSTCSSTVSYVYF
jgi:hypothetical protein